MSTPRTDAQENFMTSAVILPLFGLALGILVGALAPVSIPVSMAKYTAVAILAALDTGLGGIRAGLENRFDLVLLAAHRARLISSGQQILVDRDRDKNPVVALRELADSTISPEDLKEDLIHSLQKHVDVDEPEAEAVPMIGAVYAWPQMIAAPMIPAATWSRISRSGCAG